MDIQIDLKRGDFEAMHPTAKTFNFDAVKMTYIGNCADVKRLNELWSTWCACIGLVYLEASVPEGFVLVEKSKISYFYQDSDEPENYCSHQRDFDCLGDCIDGGDIIQIDRYAEIHLSKDTFYGAWCECESKPFSRKTREFRLFPSHEDAEKAMIKAQEQVG